MAVYILISAKETVESIKFPLFFRKKTAKFLLTAENTYGII